MALLVTGGAGYIGSHTIAALSKDFHDIHVIDNFINSSRKVKSRLKTITGKDFDFYDVDICDFPSLRNFFIEKNITSIIHFAGLKSVSQSTLQPLEYYNSNLVGTLNLMRCMTEFKVKKIIFSSSATVYGDPEYIPLDENAKSGGTTNPYGTSKFFCERVLFDYQKANPDVTVINLRYFNPVGAHPSGLIGESPVGIPNNLVPFIYQVAVGKLKYLNIYGSDYPTIDGTGVRDFIHVMDLAEGHVAALKHCNVGGFFCFNLGTGKAYSVLEVVDCFEKITGKKLPVKFVERRVGDVAECWSNPAKANSVLDWTAKRDLHAMIADGWNWQVKNPFGYE
ncbi:UDP-glucose 4-epimerase GalE [Erwinia sp. LJJL01]|uniref:UDP-glucose 4-epimerase GalE n=1 Tax=Erwinia sp. LJJL01 TaxID=3391839 RepID=UPI00105BDFF2